MGQGFSFDGEEDHVEVRVPSNLNIRGPVTVHLWAKRTVFGGHTWMVTKGAGLIGALDVPSVFLLGFGGPDQGLYEIRAVFERRDSSNVVLKREITFG